MRRAAPLALVRPAVVVAAALLGTAFFVLQTVPAAGFPLDDAWIHQTYARNLAATGRWEFVPGIVSAGSTAPLWTLWLALGYAVGAPLHAWAYGSGAAALAGLGLAAMALWRRLEGGSGRLDWLAGLAVVTTWPLVWAAASGMETLLFAALAVALCAAALAPEAAASTRRWLALGGAGGLLVLARPEGIGLLVLLGLSLVTRSRRGRAGVVTLVGAALPLVPYFAFNWWSSGTIWPNTFYAKQTEYAALLQTPLPARLWQLALVSWGGPGSGVPGIAAAHLLLLPGGLWAAGRALAADGRARRLLQALPVLWAGGLVALYAWRLPVAFQHGRYVMAAMPVWVVLGLAGWSDLLGRLGRWRARPGWLLARVAAGTLLLLQLAFLLLGARQYRIDVAFIEGEMVDVARWLRDNTPPDALVAAHDIGAIGYFAERPLIDLAGLVTPGIVPLLQDERALAAYVLASPADYLVTAPGWPYAELTAGDQVTHLYQTDYLWTQREGLNNMEVYRLDRKRP